MYNYNCSSNVIRIIGMNNPLIVSKCPCKDNIMYSVIKFTSLEEVFMSVALRLKKERS